MGQSKIKLFYADLFGAIFFVVGLLMSPICLGQIKVNEENIVSKFTLNDRFDVLLKFKSAKVSMVSADGHLTKGQKGKMVYRRLHEQARISQEGIKKYLSDNDYEFRSFCIVNCLLVRSDRRLFEMLVSNREVEKILLNDMVTLPENELALTSGARTSNNHLPWGLELVGASRVWNMGYTGQGVVIGGQDTGVEWDHPALKNSYRGWNGNTVDHNYHWHDAIDSINPLHEDSIVDANTNPCGLNISEPCDDIGSSHGTHTMGTMVGSDLKSEMTVGMAPGAKWIAVRNMERGYGSVASYLEAFEWFLAPTDLNDENPNTELAPHVINNSWSCPPKEGCNEGNFDLLEEAIKNLKVAGIVVVASAGNAGREGCRTIHTPPAFFKDAFTVGSIDINDSLSSFSSRGPVLEEEGVGTFMKPNVTAPGGGILSAVKGGSYQELSGTSMAGPHVVGLVALLISANPTLAGQVELIENIIEKSAIPKFENDSCSSDPTNVPNALHGFGRIDAVAAVQQALMSTPTINDEILQFNIFPNPTSEKLIIRVDSQVAQLNKLDIFSTTGILLQTVHINILDNTMKLDVTMLPSGIYYLRVGRRWGKFIKN